MADFSPYKRAFWATCAVLEVLGFAEFVSSCTIISTSSGHYVGGIYCGIFCVITGTLGFRSLKARSDVLWVFYLSIASVIISIIAAAVQAAYYNFFMSLAACSSYKSGTANTCGYGTVPGYLCYGDSDYFYLAESCMISYNYNYGTSSNECSCITNDGDTCYDYGGISSCDDFVNDLPAMIKTSYIIAFFCLVASLVVLAVSATALKNVAEPNALQQPLTDQPVTAHAVVVQPPPTTAPVMVYVQSPMNNSAVGASQ